MRKTLDRIYRMNRIINCWSVGVMEYWSSGKSKSKSTISCPVSKGRPFDKLRAMAGQAEEDAKAFW